MKTLPTLLAVALFAPLAQAQQHYANIQPQVPQKATQSDIVSNGLSGRDPFQLNWSTGRFDYVPVPYRVSPGAPYNPFQYNIFTGRFDYVPVPPPTNDYLNPAPGRAGGNASNYTDTRINPQIITTAPPVRSSNEAQPASTTFPPAFPPPPPTEIYRRPSARPPVQPKAPTTKPAATKPSPAPAT